MYSSGTKWWCTSILFAFAPGGGDALAITMFLVLMIDRLGIGMAWHAAKVEAIVRLCISPSDSLLDLGPFTSSAVPRGCMNSNTLHWVSLSSINFMQGSGMKAVHAPYRDHRHWPLIFGVNNAEDLRSIFGFRTDEMSRPISHGCVNQVKLYLLVLSR